MSRRQRGAAGQSAPTPSVTASGAAVNAPAGGAGSVARHPQSHPDTDPSLSPPVSPAIASAIGPAAGTIAPSAQTAAEASAGAGGRKVGRRTRHAALPTPVMLRRLSAVGLLAGVLTGAASYGAMTASDASARSSAVAARIATTTADAQVAMAQARSAGATSLVTTSAGSDTAAATAIESLSRAADRLADAGAQAPDEATRLPISRAQHALPAYAAAAASAAARSTDSASAGAAAGQLRAGDTALSEATNPLQKLVDDQLAAVASAQSLSTAIALLPVVVGGGATIALVGSMVWLARKTHRVINPPLLFGTLLVAGTTVFSAGIAAESAQIVSSAGQSTEAIRAHGLVLAAAHEARAAELAAVLPGTSAQVAEASARATTADARVSTLLNSTRDLAGSAALQAWTTYEATQRQLVLGQVGTDRGKAVNASTGQASTEFTAFVEMLGSTSATDQVAAPDAGNVLPWLALLTGLGGGAFAWAGLDRRHKDYR